MLGLMEEWIKETDKKKNNWNEEVTKKASKMQRAEPFLRETIGILRITEIWKEMTDIW